MNRDKVLELAKEAEILRQLSMEVPFVVDRLERFAALIEREVRGNAEPVAWSVFDKRTKNHWYTNESKYTAQHYVKEYAHHEPDNTLSMVVVPLYTHPAPAVVQPQGWLHAIDEAMVCSHLGVANEFDTYEDAKKKLNTLICWHVDVAIDPTVNGGRKLYPDAVVRHLLVALRMVLDDQDALDGRPRTYEYVKKALAAAKEAGL